MMNLLEEINISYNRGHLVPFVGAGFSKNIKNYPDWEEFMKSLEEELDLSPGFFKKYFHDDYLEATEYWIMKKISDDKTLNRRAENNSFDKFNKGKQELRNYIKNTFKKIEKSYNYNDWESHVKLISARSINQIFTTNWDHALETACLHTPENNKVFFEKIVYDNDFKAFSESIAEHNRDNNRCIQIIKYHGDYEYDDSIIACETDYFRRMTGLNALDIKLKNEILYNDLLFIGYSFSDVNIKFLFFQMEVLLKQISESFRPKVFFISRELPSSPRMELFQIRKNINIYYLFDVLEDDYSITKNNLTITFRKHSSSEIPFEFKNNEIILFNKIPKYKIIKESLNDDYYDFEAFYKEFDYEITKYAFNKLFSIIFKNK